MAKEDLFEHERGAPYGENLAYHSAEDTPCSELVKMFYDEIELYNFDQGDFSMSQLSLNSSDTDDWDRSMSSDIDAAHTKTPRNSVSFPGNGGADERGPSQNGSLGRGAGKRTLSELLKLHAEKGTDVNFTPEEARRVAEVLGQWVSPSKFR